ncbi:MULTISPECIES: beta-ketoacyl-ACP synthase III [unclassified Solwaraspora]|uniref:beta-ketoacyl-ACP synthase III n=1 Tax=unclassified Solwaraspora TaxID=2627926 RepID=UPI00248B89F7|nr:MULTISPECIES: beta-ketoacyl-ACP synthase III [unclassified Solwaraspora]WBB95645.1 ketoacyl-ACP synthase III [Solwaraspora sp. WMMA2059]WBC20451.1 ketoacyl-ACP synthase III [Solwaraspora sp. WMMA2080]WJK37396.1 beta-ketoacyl-ACP synthase III [Solwaraspora sp. WMMA2065]
MSGSRHRTRRMAGAPVTTRSAVIAGVGSWVPPRIVTNEELARHLDTSDDWIRSRTGIARRHVVDPGVGTAALAIEAGAAALKSAGGDVDSVIVATSTPERLCPATAPQVAAGLGLSGVAAHDVAAVCSGFLYALNSAAGQIATGTADRVLVVGADAFSTIVDPTDRQAAVIFADGAGAVVLRAGSAAEPGALGPCVLGSDGEFAELIMIPGGGSAQRSTGRLPGSEDLWFQMRGRDVYRHAVERTSNAALAALKQAGWDPADIDWFVPHQANARICTAIAERLGIPMDRVASNIERVGNTAAASIPLLIAELAAARAFDPGARVLTAAFGGGLTWGATTFTWPVTHGFGY